MDETYQADKVDAKETQAMCIFRLAYMEGGLYKIPDNLMAFNIVEHKKSDSYIVQAGRIENDKFIMHEETTSIPFPKGKNLQQVAQNELRHTKQGKDNFRTNIFLNGELFHRLS
jgi:hypothetical protein